MSLRKFYTAHHAILVNIFVQLIFMSIVLTSFLYMLHQGALPQNAADTSFHYHRIYDIINSLKHFQLPQFNNYTGSFYGVATSTFYPWLIYLPLLPLAFICSHLVFGLLLYNIGFLISLETSYWSSRTYFNRKLASLLFSLIYIVSSCDLSFSLLNGNLGTEYAFAFMPLVFFGFLALIRNNHYKMLTIGLILLAYSHIIETVIGIGLVLLLTLMFNKKFSLNKFKSLIKSGIIFMTTSVFIWLPILVMFLNNHIYHPVAIGGIRLDAQLLPSRPSYLVSYDVFSISDILCIILGLLFWKILSKYIKTFFIITIGIFVLNIRPINIFLITRTPFSIIQRISRLALVSHLLLSFILVCILINIIYKKWSIQNFWALTGALLCTIFMFASVEYGALYNFRLQCSLPYMQKHYLYNNNNNAYYYFVLNNISHQLLTRRYAYLFEHMKSMKFHQYQYINQMNSRYKHILMEADVNAPYRLNKSTLDDYWFIHNTSYQDYAPVNVAKHQMYYRFKSDYKKITFHRNIIQINSPRNQTRWIPYATYNTQKYHMYLNHKLVKHPIIKHHLIYAHLHKGLNKIKVYEPVMWYRWLAIIISIIGLCLLTLS